MPPFKSPSPPHQFQPSREKRAITAHFRKRGVPVSTGGRLLLASWNIANLGAQGRSEQALQLIAHLLKRFDLIAVQEVNDDFAAFLRVMEYVGRGFDYVMSDTAGNNERLAYVYRTSRVHATNLAGELSLRKRNFPTRTVSVRYTVRNVEKVDRIRMTFEPFDRNPYIRSFVAGEVGFTLANCHLYFGSSQNSSKVEDRRKYARRVLEIHALARWADGRHNKTTTFDRDIVLLGDMNVPAMDPAESTYHELIRYGWKPVQYVSRTGGSNLGNDRTYDQMTFAPTDLGQKVTAYGVFDFDNAIFKSLWNDLEQQLGAAKAVTRFNQHIRHHVSDHRPLWIQLDVR